jgi:hypothetical protein
VPQIAPAKGPTVIERVGPQTATTSGTEPVAVPETSSTPEPRSSALPAPQPTVAPTPDIALLHVVEAGEFASSYPPSPAQPELYNAILASVTGHIHARILVDEHGHATAVTFLTAPAGTESTEELRQKLLALTYVPAECDGLACAGTFDARR